MICAISNYYDDKQQRLGRVGESISDMWADFTLTCFAFEQLKTEKVLLYVDAITRGELLWNTW